MILIHRRNQGNELQGARRKESAAGEGPPARDMSEVAVETLEQRCLPYDIIPVPSRAVGASVLDETSARRAALTHGVTLEAVAEMVRAKRPEHVVIS
jgi:hypothetical protein